MEAMEHSTKLALRVSGTYLLVGALWILLSDATLSSLTSDVHLHAQMQIFKGWFFVLVSGSILYLFLKKWTAVFLRDAAKRRGVEETLVESEERYRKLVTLSPDAFYVHVDGHVTLANPAMCKLLGAVQSAELIGKPVLDIIHPDYHELVQERWKRVMDGQVADSLEEKFVRLDGSVVDVEVSAVAVDFRGEKEVQVIARDISERKRADEILRGSEQRYRLLFKSNPHPMWFFDAVTLAFLDVNEAAIQHYGYSRKEFLTMTIKDLCPPEDSDGLLADQALQLPGMSVAGIWKYHKKDGTIIHVEVTSHEIKYSGRKSKVVLANDITERVRAEEELRIVFSSVPCLLWHARVVRVGNRYVWTMHLSNEAAASQFLPVTRVNGQSYCEAWQSAKLDEERPLLEKDYKEALELGTPGYSHEFRCRLVDGTLRWLCEDVRITPHPDGVWDLVGVCTDITDRKRAEEQVQFRARLLNEIGEAVVATDLQGTITYWNRAAEKIYGWSAPEALGQNVLGVTTADSTREQAGRIFENLRKGESWSGEILLRRKDGTEFPGGVTDSPALNEQGTLIGIIGISADITERKRGEEAIRESEARFRQLTEAIKEVFWLSDPTKKELLYVSHGYEEIWGRTCESLLHSPASWIESIHSDDRGRVMQAKQAEKANDLLYRIIRPDGSIRWVHDQAFPIKNQTGDVVRMAGIVEDVTEKKSLEEQLRQAQKLESLGTLAGGIAHDFNNILGIIMGHSTLLRRGKSDPVRISKSAEVIEQSAQRGASLVRQLLTFARKSDVTLESVVVNDIVTEVVRLLEETFPKVITIATNLQAQLPSIVADVTHVHQVLLNLCVNARDAMLPQGGALTIATELLHGDVVRKRFPQADAVDYMLLSIADTGTGMDEATRLRIFEPFFTTKEEGKGTGLGLATVYGIVEGHRGFVGVSSEIGRGTTFNVYFPVPLQSVRIAETPAVFDAEVRGGTETILVVEDEELLRALLAGILESKGYHVLAACDGAEALTTFSQSDADINLVLTDLGLPRIDGEALMLGLKEINPDIRVIVVSGYVEPEQRSRLLRLGAKELISKPFRPDDLLWKVREVLDR